MPLFAFQLKIWDFRLQNLYMELENEKVGITFSNTKEQCTSKLPSLFGKVNRLDINENLSVTH